jgi:hypothetical protein
MNKWHPTCTIPTESLSGRDLEHAFAGWFLAGELSDWSERTLSAASNGRHACASTSTPATFPSTPTVCVSGSSRCNEVWSHIVAGR